MSIDRTTGELLVGEQRLGLSLGERDFLNSELGSTAKQIRRSGTRRYYETWRKLSPELEMGLTLGFLPGGPLQRISVQFVNPGTRGSEWSKAKEDDIKRFHDQWLIEQLGHPPYQFKWGKVLSIVEPHWYSANIVIDYSCRSSGMAAAT